MQQSTRQAIVAGAFVVISATSPAHMEDDPLLVKLQINELEAGGGDGGDFLAWNIDAWLGKDLHKLWVKSEGKRASGETENSELQLLYSRAVAPFWDLQIGWRKDWLPKPERNWLVLGFEGLAPYFIEVDSALFVGESNRAGLRIDAERELLLSRRVILKPEVELNFHSRNDPNTGTGSGLSEVEISLRLHYAVNRQFLPYVGVNWEKKIGNTADYARDEGEGSDDLQWFIGVSTWF